MSPPSSSARLEVLLGPLAGQILPLVAPELVVGRDAPGISLSGYAQVSRHHARFFVQNGLWCVEDLHSTNGTFVNGARAMPSFTLRDGVTVQLGDFQARFQLGQSNALATVAPSTQLSPLPPPVPAPFGGASYQPPPYLPQIYAPPPKNSGLALLFSFLLVGGGQFYNGETNKGVGMLLGVVFCFLLGFFTCGLTWLGSPVFYIWSLIDAVQSAERINRESALRP